MARETLISAVGAEVRRLRLARKLAQQALADRARLSRNFVGLVERGQRNVTLPTLDALARALGTTASRIVAAAERASIMRAKTGRSARRPPARRS